MPYSWTTIIQGGAGSEKSNITLVQNTRVARALLKLHLLLGRLMLFSAYTISVTYVSLSNILRCPAVHEFSIVRPKPSPLIHDHRLWGTFSPPF